MNYKNIDYISIWENLITFSETIYGAIALNILLIAFLSLCIKWGLMFIKDKIGIIEHLNYNKLEKLEAVFDIIALLSNIVFGVLLSIHLNKPLIYGLICGICAVALHVYIDSDLFKKNIKFLWKYKNPKNILKKILKDK